MLDIGAVKVSISKTRAMKVVTTLRVKNLIPTKVVEDSSQSKHISSNSLIFYLRRFDKCHTLGGPRAVLDVKSTRRKCNVFLITKTISENVRFVPILSGQMSYPCTMLGS